MNRFNNPAILPLRTHHLFLEYHDYTAPEFDYRTTTCGSPHIQGEPDPHAQRHRALPKKHCDDYMKLLLAR